MPRNEPGNFAFPLASEMPAKPPPEGPQDLANLIGANFQSIPGMPNFIDSCSRTVQCPVHLVQVGYMFEDFEKIPEGQIIKFDYYPDASKPQTLPNEGKYAGQVTLLKGPGIKMDEATIDIDGFYIRKIEKLQVPCYRNCIAPLLNNCLRSEGVMPSLLACPTLLALE